MENASLLLIDKSTNIYPPLLHTAKPFFFYRTGPSNSFMSPDIK